MSAEYPKKRTKTAKELAEKFGVTTRTIQNLFAEPREEYLARAQERTQKILELRGQGLKIKEIAEQLNTPYGTVGRVIHNNKSQQNHDCSA